MNASGALRAITGIASRRSPRSSPGTIERLTHEWGLAQELDPAWAVQPLALAHEDGRAILVLDDPGGEPIPEKFYGPMREVETLLASFDRVVRTGTPELVLVSGYSDIGKSSVVHELHRALVPPAASSQRASSIGTSATSRTRRSPRPSSVSCARHSGRATPSSRAGRRARAERAARPGPRSRADAVDQRAAARPRAAAAGRAKGPSREPRTLSDVLRRCCGGRGGPVRARAGTARGRSSRSSRSDRRTRTQIRKVTTGLLDREREDRRLRLDPDDHAAQNR